jgi:hypothetical protein
VIYGGALAGVLPTDGSVSWEGHLFGFLGGLLAARVIPNRRPQHRGPAALARLTVPPIRRRKPQGVGQPPVYGGLRLLLGAAVAAPRRRSLDDLCPRLPRPT